MMKFLRKGIALCVFFTLLASVIKGQDAVKIPIKAVVRGTNGDPVKGATISIEGNDVLTISNQLGEFSIAVDANTPFAVSAPGYRNLLVIAVPDLKVVTLNKEDRIVNVGFKNAEENNLPPGVSTVNVAQLFEKNFITYGFDGMEAFAPGFNGNNLWGHELFFGTRRWRST